MSNIYIVQGDHGEWSDRTEWTICCYKDEAVAADVVAKLLALQEYNVAYNQREYAEFEVPYREAHVPEVAPCHPAAPEGMHALQQACSHGNGTETMKAEYRKLQKLHIQNIEVAKAAYREFDARRHAYEDELASQREIWFIENYKPSAELLEVSEFIPKHRSYRGCFSSDVRYSYYSAELR